MPKVKKKRGLLRRPLKDREVLAVLVVLCLAYWLPFFRYLDLVSYDGTYYLNEARKFFSGVAPSGAFPIGYPFFVAVLLPFVGDAVRAGQIVALLSGIGSVLITYVLAKEHMSRLLAFCCALFLASIPLVLRISLTTYSESPYIFWVLLGILFYSRKRLVLSALFFGIAAITRPEVLAIFGVLWLWSWRQRKLMVKMALVFALVYSLNILMFYVWFGRVVVLPKSKFLGTSVEAWTKREQTAEDVVKPPESTSADTTVAAADTVPPPPTERRDIGKLASNFFKRLPKEFILTARHVGYVVFLLAIAGAIMRPRLYLLATFLPFIAYPLFTVRSDARYILPYIPVLVLYAFVAVERVRRAKRAKLLWAGYAALAAAGIAGIVINRNQLTDKVDGALFEFKDLGTQLRSRIPRGSRMADRKPYISFYADAEYIEIPLSTYDETLDALVAEDVDYLVIHGLTIKKFRPKLLGLLTDDHVIRGETRFTPAYTFGGRALVYRRERDPLNLTWRQVTRPEDGLASFPRWSPDGSRLAFCAERDGSVNMYLVSAVEEGATPELLLDWRSRELSLTWSPDGSQIAFSSDRTGVIEIYLLDLATRRVVQLTRDRAMSVATAWSATGGQIIGFSGRGGTRGIWSFDLASGSQQRLSPDGMIWPSVDPSGRRRAWLKKREGLFIVDRSTGKTTSPKAPVKVNFPAEWSPDGNFIAATASDMNDDDVYLLKADGSSALALAKGRGADAQPHWSPDGQKLVFVSEHGGGRCVWIVSGLKPYLDRLDATFPAVALKDYGPR